MIISLAVLASLAGCSENRGLKLFVAAEQGEQSAPLEEALPAEKGAAAEAAAAPTTGEVAAPKTEAPAPKRQPEIYAGTGVLAKSRPATGVKAVGTSGDITFNFVDTNVREVVRSILGDTLGLNYAIDPSIQGAVTIQTSRPLGRDALLEVMEQILGLVGAALVSDGGLYRIVPAEEAARGAPLDSPAGLRQAGRAGNRITVVPLKFVAAEEVAKMIEPVAANGAIVNVNSARNLLILAGTQAELKTLVDLVAMFDIDWMAGMSFGLFPLESADAKDIAKELETLFGEESGSPIAGLIRVVPIERLNTVLVISQSESHVREAGKWIGRLDRGTDAAAQRVYVYYVQNGRAEDLAGLLREIFEVQAPRIEEKVRLAPGLQPIELGSEMTRTGETQTAATEPATTSPPATGGRTITRLPPTTVGAERRQANPRRQTAGTRTGATATPGARTGEGQGAAEVSTNVRIIADVANNAIVILATEREYRKIESALVKLDIVPLQVLIEATIAEVQLNDELRYGVQWFFQSGHSSFTLGQSEGTVITARDAVTQAFPGFSYLFNAADVRVVLNALESVTNVNVISSPQLMVLDNQTALLQVGDEVPVATQSAVSVTDPSSPIVNSVEFRDTGVILHVTPRVNAGGLVTMEIEQEVSDVVPTTTSGIDSPTIQQRRIQSTVAVQSGQTVALGGLIRDNRSLGKSGLPVLQEIPVLGALFRDTSNKFDRTELLVMITPRVVRNEVEARQVTDELRQRLRKVTPLQRKIE